MFLLQCYLHKRYFNCTDIISTKFASISLENRKHTFSLSPLITISSNWTGLAFIHVCHSVAGQMSLSHLNHFFFTFMQSLLIVYYAINLVQEYFKAIKACSGQYCIRKLAKNKCLCGCYLKTCIILTTPGFCIQSVLIQGMFP